MTGPAVARIAPFVVALAGLLIGACATGVNPEPSTTTGMVSSPSNDPAQASHDPAERSVRAAFFYPWFPFGWGEGEDYPRTRYSPTMGYYDSSDLAVIDEQVQLASAVGLDAFIVSWWGVGHRTDAPTRRILDRIADSPDVDFRIAVYYEEEGQSDPSPNEIADDLRYLERMFESPAYLRVDGRPVVFVWADAQDGSGMAARWAAATTISGSNVFTVLKVFGGFREVANQPDSWHQYAPASGLQLHEPYSAVVSPGFWHRIEAEPRLSRDPDRFRADVEEMAGSPVLWQLVTSWNEWGEGTAVEPSAEFGTIYLDILAEALNGHSSLDDR